MRQIYYTLCTLLRECGSNIIRVISLSLGLTIGVLLFSQIAFELSYEQCYPEAERLALVRCQMTNASTGETRGDDGENMLLLVDTAERPEDIDANRAKRAADAAKEELLQKKSLQEYKSAQANLARARSRLRVKERWNGGR